MRICLCYIIVCSFVCRENEICHHFLCIRIHFCVNFGKYMMFNVIVINFIHTPSLYWHLLSLNIFYYYIRRVWNTQSIKKNGYSLTYARWTSNLTKQFLSCLNSLFIIFFCLPLICKYSFSPLDTNLKYYIIYNK